MSVPLNRSGSAGAVQPSQSPLSGDGATNKGGAPTPGAGESSSTMKSLNNAVVATRSFGAAVWTGIRYVPTLISNFFSRIAEKIVELIWGVQAVEKVEVVVSSWGGFGSDYVVQMPLEKAIRENYRNKDGTIWTAAYAISKKKCSEDWVRTRALHVIEFKYNSFTGVKDMKMKLSSAIRDSYFTWDQAIDNKFITLDEAIRGGFVKDPAKKEAVK